MSPEAFKNIRKLCGFTQVELAAKLSVSWRAARHYEKGTRKVPGPVARLMLNLERRHKRSGDGA